MIEGAVRQSSEYVEIYSALVEAQGRIGHAIADKRNTYHQSNYADLANVIAAIRQQFLEHDLAVLQFPFTQVENVERSYRDENGKPVYEIHQFQDEGEELEQATIPIMETVPVINVVVRTRLIHSSGQWIESDLSIPVSMGKNSAQSIGIATTYARRYSLMAIAGVAPDEDDGESLTDAHPMDGTRQPVQKQDQSQKTESQPVSTPKRERASASRPQGLEGEIQNHKDRLRQAENMTTLRALYTSSVRHLEERASQQQMADLEAVKDEVKQKLDPDAAQAVQEEAADQAADQAAEQGDDPEPDVQF